MREGGAAAGDVSDDVPDAKTLAAIAALPSADEWPDIDDAERMRRERVLWEISLRLLEDGPRHATPSPERGRQFIPFVALRGYDEMVAEVEHESRRDDDADDGICSPGANSISWGQDDAQEKG